MSSKIGGFKYIPGMHSHKRTTGEQLAENYFKELDARLLHEKEREKKTELPPTICFSRKIGVGALEIAEIVAKKTGYRVVDRELVEHIAKTAKLSEKTVAAFDERYAGGIQDFLSIFVKEKTFATSDYSRYLFRSAPAMAGLSPTIFVGRGIHLILPRDRVLAVRFICPDAYRIERIAKILKITTDRAKTELAAIDHDQRAFFDKVFGKKDAIAYEFDMVINCEFIQAPEDAADIVSFAFKKKFVTCFAAGAG